MSESGAVMAEFFRRQSLTRTYHKGHVICFQGERFNQVFMVKSGIVKIYDIDKSGSERTISLFVAPDVFPMVWLLKDPPPTHLFYYEALTDTTCYLANVSDARSHFQANPEVVLSLLDHLAQNYLNSVGRVQNLEKSHLRERLEFVLYWLARRVGTVRGNVAQIDAAITQEDIARLAGVTRESMSLALGRIGRRKIFWRENHSTYIDLSKLDTGSMPTVFPHPQSEDARPTRRVPRRPQIYY